MERIYIYEQIKKLKKERERELSDLKNNIHSNYLLARLDFAVIKNIEDEIQVFDEIITKLDELQKRIIDRNKNC